MCKQSTITFTNTLDLHSYRALISATVSVSISCEHSDLLHVLTIVESGAEYALNKKMLTFANYQLDRAQKRGLGSTNKRASHPVVMKHSSHFLTRIFKVKGVIVESSFACLDIVIKFIPRIRLVLHQ